jgi:hypothetical protein
MQGNNGGAGVKEAKNLRRRELELEWTVLFHEGSEKPDPSIGMKDSSTRKIKGCPTEICTFGQNRSEAQTLSLVSILDMYSYFCKYRNTI